MGVPAEAIERRGTHHYRLQCGGDLRIAGIGSVPLAIHVVPMDLGVKSFANLSGRAGKVDQHAALIDGADPEAMRAQPTHDGIDIALRGAKLDAEFYGCKPLVKAGRIRVVQPVDELIQGLLAVGAALKLKLHVSQEEIVRNGASVELRTRRNVRIAGERDKLRLVGGVRGAGEKQE